MIDTDITVDDSHFEYLVLQKGKLDPLKKQRANWNARYLADLRSSYDEIKPFLPERCWGLLDIGSGLGGIDVLLYRHYYQPRESIDITTVEDTDAGRGTVVMRVGGGPYINLLDGEDDPPEMKLHRQTFNSMRVAKDFQVKNGVPADRFAYYTPDSKDFVKPFDLVVSFGSWCFHYEPNVYLPRLFSGGGLTTGSVVILDLRHAKRDWLQQISDTRRMRLLGVVREASKFLRLAYVVE